MPDVEFALALVAVAAALRVVSLRSAVHSHFRCEIFAVSSRRLFSSRSSSYSSRSSRSHSLPARWTFLRLGSRPDLGAILAPPIQLRRCRRHNRSRVM